MLSNFWDDEFMAVGSEPSERAGLIAPHEAAVSGDIGGENGRKPALYPLSAHDAFSLAASRHSLCCQSARFNGRSGAIAVQRRQGMTAIIAAGMSSPYYSTTRKIAVRPSRPSLDVGQTGEARGARDSADSWGPL